MHLKGYRLLERIFRNIKKSKIMVLMIKTNVFIHISLIDTIAYNFFPVAKQLSKMIQEIKSGFISCATSLSFISRMNTTISY